MKYLLLVVSSFILWACSNSDGGTVSVDMSVEISEDSLAGMVRVDASNASVLLGTNDEFAKVNERPQMQVSLDYVFSMGSHEVTCKEFNSLMKPKTGLVVDCPSDSFPATNLTYYDAVLFANERSKAEKRDTVYTYSKALFDTDKHCTNLEGFVFHPETQSYRLPTEAEWMLVAAQNWNLQNGWIAENSDYKLHKVCSKGKADPSKNVCDMVGNVMEWVNDWLGNFSDTTVNNYVGAPDGGALGQRVLKGGSYRNSKTSITLYGRGDVYTVTSSTRADYVGFRLAFGSIPSPVWMNSSGLISASRVIPLATSATVRSQTGTYRVKLAFRNDLTGNIAFIDYHSGSQSVTEIVDSIDAYHPDISPDGKRVAFCTKLEGVSGNSALYVRDLNADGTNLVKLDVKSAAIPRWRILDNGDTVIVYVTDAGNNKNESDFKASSTWQVKFAKGKFGKPQKLFDGAYHGGVSDDDALAVTGARVLRARVSGRDTVWYKDGEKAEQACNASLAKDGTKRTLFLDFGGKTGKSFVGKNYGTHERLLVLDSTGKLIQSVAASAGYSFDHSEWGIGYKNLAVASLVNANGSHKKIVLINLSDSSIVDLAEGDELWHPCLWINSSDVTGFDSMLDLDSAGVYLTESHELEQAYFRIKLELYWKYLDSIKVFLAGSSRMELGMDPDLYPKQGMFNMGVYGIDPARDFYFIKNYALNHSEKLKVIAVSIDLDYWRCREDHLGLVLSAGVGYAYDANHSFWKDGLPNGFVDAVENAFPADAKVNQFSSRGGVEYPSRGWTADAVDVLLDSVFTDKEMSCLDSRIDDLMNIVKMASKQKIYVIGIIFPQAPQYKETGAFGLYGLQRSVAKKKIAYLDSLAKSNQYFIFMDENKMGNHDYTDAMAQNRDHLSFEGAKKMTTRLDSVLKTLK